MEQSLAMPCFTEKHMPGASGIRSSDEGPGLRCSLEPTTSGLIITIVITQRPDATAELSTAVCPLPVYRIIQSAQEALLCVNPPTSKEEKQTRKKLT